MKKLSIDVNNTAEVVAALAAVNGKATSFATTSASTVIGVGNRLSRMLHDFGMSLKDRAGCEVIHCAAGPSANKYKYAAAATLITLRIGSDGKTVRLVGVSKSSVYPKERECFRPRLTRRAYDAYMSRCADRFEVIKTTEIALAA